MYKNRGARLLASRVPRARARVIISSFVFFACCRGWRRNGWASARVLRSSGAPRRSSTRPRDPDTTPTRAHEKPAHTRLSIQNATAHTSPPRKRSDPAHHHHHLQVHKSQRGGQPGRPARETTTAAPAEPFHLGVTHASPTHRTRCREGRAAIRHPKCTARDRATCAFLAVRRAPKPKALVCLRRLPCFRARRGVAS
jgi:hypothetical protein